MLISLRSLAQCPGGVKPCEYSIDLSGEKVNSEFPFQSDISVKGTLTDRSGAVFFKADVSYTLSVHCARCGKALEIPQDLHLDFLISSSEETDDDPDDVFCIGGDVLETDDIVVPEIIMNIDISYLCSEDCKGLCMKCGANLNDGPCGCSKDTDDEPKGQLAKLKELLENKK